MSGEIPVSNTDTQAITTRRDRRWKRTLAAGVLTAVGAPALAGCLGGGPPSLPDACNPLATSISQLHPNRTGEPSCFYPEIAKEMHTVIPIDAHSTIYNFTHHEIDADAVRSTFAFYNNMINSLRPVFLNQKGVDFTVPLGGKNNIQGSMIQRFFSQDPKYAHAYFIAPAKDNSNVSVFERANDTNIYNDPANTQAYTQDDNIGKRQVPVTVSYIYEPGPDGANLLHVFNVEVCQSLIEGFATVNNPGSNNFNKLFDDNQSVQESVCNTLGKALADVQQGMTLKDFITTYANPDAAVPLEGGTAPSTIIPLQPWVYFAMKEVKPAIAA